MANPVINGVEQDLSKGRVAQQGYVPPQQGQFTQHSGYGTQSGHFSQQAPYGTGQGQYVGAPDRAITYEDVINKSGIMLGLLFLAGLGTAVACQYIPQLGGMAASIGAIGAVIVSMFCIFKRTVSPGLFVAYSVLEGVALGGISYSFEYSFPGVVMQALVGTAAIFGVTLVLFRSGYVRGSSKMMKFALISLIGILVYSIASWVLTMFGVISNPMGLDSVKVMGIPLGILVGLFAVIVGAICLILDFEVARQAVETGAQRSLAWRIAFGIVLDTVYIYIHLLRVLASMRND